MQTPTVSGELDPADPYAREAQTFPHLDPEMTARVAQFGIEERVPAGAMLFERGLLDRPADGRNCLEAPHQFVRDDRRPPNTEWLTGCLALDPKGFVVTGRDETGQPLPSPYATTRPGIFALGDVRAGSVKRVASSVGAIHQFLSPAS